MKGPQTRATRLLGLARRIVEHETAIEVHQNHIRRLRAEMVKIANELHPAGELEGPPDPRLPPGRVTQADRVLAFFRVHPDRHVMIAAADVARAIPEVKPEVVHVVLSKLAAAGTLERVRHGHYRLPA